MRDRLGRDIYYLRMSLTERCNLKCIYCREENEHCKAKNELTSAEYEVLLRQFARIGIRKVRLTGGEPLVRRDLEKIIHLVAQYPQMIDICMTTNAQGLADRIDGLQTAGLGRINISLDSLNPERYQRMTRGGRLSEVFRGIEAALKRDMPVKVNAVLVRGENDGEVGEFIQLAKQYPMDVRFIELMPFGKLGEEGEHRVFNSEILEQYPFLHPVEARYPSQPSVDYTADGFLGRVGFINPISHRFCGTCNRVRLTSDGMLRMCLGQNEETDLKPYLEDSDALYHAIYKAIYEKPERHGFTREYHASRTMNQIGG